ncbi:MULTISPECIES: hypothetical protein [Pseudomonas syringae group genomosp. 2]|uniref:hypothetical protein n=1 Tax=Pseudomonas syringae group genomosp. 2 TaxID=251698 RepID=UPI0006B8A98D|nr:MULTISPECIES: hypothetical protein [Pseudomonas syringae group genomosp. 2]
MPTQPIELIQRVIALSQHEAAHWIVAVASGFDAQEIKLEVQSLEAHRGKSNTTFDTQFETIKEMRAVVRQRVLTKLAGAMGEAIDRGQRKVNAQAAHIILEDGDTGAGQDYAVARELTALLHNSTPLSLGFSSRDLLIELLADSFNLVTLNMKPICDLADALTLKVMAGKGVGEVSKDEIHQLQLYCLLP